MPHQPLLLATWGRLQVELLSLAVGQSTDIFISAENEFHADEKNLNFLKLQSNKTLLYTKVNQDDPCPQ